MKGAAWIAVGGFVAKLLGALYRVPLTNLLGGRGLGLYQMVYPVYCLLLTVSATGIPSSIAKLTAERLGKGESAVGVFRSALKLFVLIGLVGTAIMAIVAPYLARAQGSEEALGGYYALAPSVALTSAISVYRGWFQGRNQMRPTALSEIIEQAVKVGLGVLFAYLFRGDIPKAVTFLLLSVSISELAALFFMAFLYRKATGKLPKEGGRVASKEILRLSVPVTFSAILLPLSGLLDSVLAPRLLRYTADPVALYGLFSGGAVTVVNLPVSVCYGIAAAAVPAVASSPTPRKKIFFALGITLLVSLPATAGLYLFADGIAATLYRSLSGEELSILSGLIKAFAISATLLSCVQTLSACLTAQGKPSRAAISMLIAVGVKTAAYLVWLKNPQISVYGLAYATNLCYLVAFFLDFVYNLSVSRKRGEKKK